MALYHEIISLCTNGENFERNTKQSLFKPVIKYLEYEQLRYDKNIKIYEVV